MKKFFILTLLLLLQSLFISVSAQNDETEIFVIDSYITQEKPQVLVVSFFTSDSCTSKIKLGNKFFRTVSKDFTENHFIKINLNKIKSDTSFLFYKLKVKNKNGNEKVSEIYEVEIPKDFLEASENSSSFFSMCCIGGTIFLMPSPSYVVLDRESKWGFSKEFPLFTIYSIGYNYPKGYYSVEYSYVHNSDKQHFFRTGYKHIFQLEFIEYISPGINFVTNFNGYNGLSPEISLGLFKIKSVFTLYARYRYNFKLNDYRNDFHEISIGLYSDFFSINF